MRFLLPNITSTTIHVYISKIVVINLLNTMFVIIIIITINITMLDVFLPTFLFLTLSLSLILSILN